MEFNNDVSDYDDSKRRKILLIIFVVSILVLAALVASFLFYRNEKINKAKEETKVTGPSSEEQKKIQEDARDLDEIRKKVEESQVMSDGTKNAVEARPATPEVSSGQAQELDDLKNNTTSSGVPVNQDTQDQINQLDELRNN